MILVEIAGHLGDDAEERTTTSGKRVITLRLATNVRQGGKDEVVWWRANIWDDRFDRMLPYLKKGTGLIVIGEMAKPDTYTDKNGVTRVSLTLSVALVKFSPFGRNQQEKQIGGPSASVPNPQYEGASSFAQATDQEPAMSTGGAASASPYAGDDLPF